MKKVISILLMLLLCFPAYSQDASLTDSQTEQKSKQIEIYFDLNSYVIDPEYQNNGENLIELSNLITQLQSDDLVTISSIEINSYASPDGGRHYNEKITKNRTNSIYNYLLETTSIPDSIIVKKNAGIDWEGLQHSVEASTMKHRDEILYILKNSPIETWSKVNPNDRWLTLTDSMNKQLMDFKGGEPYRYMKEEFFPQLRRSSIATIYFKATAPAIVDNKNIDILQSEQLYTSQPSQEESAPEGVIENIAPIHTDPEDINNNQQDDIKTPLFALKTNLLYDIALMPSIEVEVPIGKHWSVAGEWIFPWWTTSDNAYALQMLSGQIEGKYWFGDRTNKPQLTGWFAGLYAGGGLYDLQWDGNGYQGEFFIASGLSGGYAHTINKSGSLRMEYSLGFGYLKTNYRYYEGMQDNEYLVWQHDGNYTWIGPTKAKVSLVWMLGKKGGKR
ncbi:MAG: DUF3575 domain-containing protein [Rikenellaceae bacterium]